METQCLASVPGLMSLSCPSACVAHSAFSPAPGLMNAAIDREEQSASPDSTQSSEVDGLSEDAQPAPPPKDEINPHFLTRSLSFRDDVTAALKAMDADTLYNLDCLHHGSDQEQITGAQSIGASQVETLKMLVEGANNVSAVGDVLQVLFTNEGHTFKVVDDASVEAPVFVDDEASCEYPDEGEECPLDECQLIMKQIFSVCVDGAASFEKFFARICKDDCQAGHLLTLHIRGLLRGGQVLVKAVALLLGMEIDSVEDLQDQNLFTDSPNEAGDAPASEIHPETVGNRTGALARSCSVKTYSFTLNDSLETLITEPEPTAIDMSRWNEGAFPVIDLIHHFQKTDVVLSAFLANFESLCKAVPREELVDWCLYWKEFFVETAIQLPDHVLLRITTEFYNLMDTSNVQAKCLASVANMVKQLGDALSENTIRDIIFQATTAAQFTTRALRDLLRFHQQTSALQYLIHDPAPQQQQQQSQADADEGKSYEDALLAELMFPVDLETTAEEDGGNGHGRGLLPAAEIFPSAPLAASPDPFSFGACSTQ